MHHKVGWPSKANASEAESVIEPVGDVPEVRCRVRFTNESKHIFPIGNFVQLPIGKRRVDLLGLDICCSNLCSCGYVALDYCASFHPEEDTCLCDGAHSFSRGSQEIER